MPKRTVNTPRRPSHPTSRPAPPLEVVDPRWVLKALGVTIAFALFCAYLTVCVLFYFQQWQLVLTPSRSMDHSPADAGMAFTEVHFDNDSSGTPQLDGWWIPSDAPSRPTVLMLHAGGGSIGDAIGAVHSLHAAQLNVLLFDYRGFGRSSGKHPTEARMEADSDAAFAYLESVQHVPAAEIVLYGSGAGASLAVRLCAKNPQIAAVILDSPDGDFGARVLRDPRAKIVPARLLFHEYFPLAKPLQTLSTPKLLLADTSGSAPLDFTQAANPKMTVEFAMRDEAAVTQTIRRFLDMYFPPPPALLTPDH